ncbi:MAG TPA: LLM class F420-dependent oxidoreductase [Dehalococcoidia bacterium]|nr:LLM class F420-dependent oxidoreductase [Dehalococcoidia bacterium]
MKIGVTIPNHFGVADPQQVIALGCLAEELDYDSLWVMDHLFNVGYIQQRLDDKPYYHPLATLTYLAAVTKRITLGTSVMVLPYHNPVELAKYAATLDQFSGGRVILGVGAGGMVEEFEALGIPTSQRAALSNEAIRVMRELWTKARASVQSKNWRFEDIRFFPKPVQKPHIPIWVGGTSDGAKRRAATLGDGWHPNGMTPEGYRAACDEVRELAAKAGRAPDMLVMSVRVNVAVGPPSTERAAARDRLSGDASQAVDVLSAFQEAGCEHVCLSLDSGDVQGLEQTMRLFAADVVPSVR